jgi:hypothetical protein
LVLLAIKPLMNGKLQAPNFKEPQYHEWASLSDELLFSLRGQVSQNLSSVLNAPDLVTEEPDVVLDELAEDDEEDVAVSVNSFYGPMRNAFRLFYQLTSTSDSSLEVDERDSIPSEFQSAFFRAGESFVDDTVLSPLYLQKLSHLLDVAEVGLVRETALRSRAFFAALVRLRDLHQVVAEAVDTIQTVRKGIEIVESAVTQPGIALASLERRRNNIAAAEGCLNRLAKQLETEAHVDVLIDEGLLVEAMELDENSSEDKANKSVFFFSFFFSSPF